MWPGPYGQGGGSRKYVLASLDQSLRRLGLDYVDIFYSHRFDPETPIEETMRALDDGGSCRQGALRRASPRYSTAKTHEAATIARDLGTPLLIHQPSATRCSTAGSRSRAFWTSWRSRAWAASRSRRWPRDCSPTATSTGSQRARAPPAGGSTIGKGQLSDATLQNLTALNAIAAARGQSPGSDGAGLGAAGLSDDLASSSAPAGSSSSTPTSTRWTISPSPTTSWRRSTGTPWSPASTSGRSRPRTDAVRTAVWFLSAAQRGNPDTRLADRVRREYGDGALGRHRCTRTSTIPTGRRRALTRRHAF